MSHILMPGLAHLQLIWHAVLNLACHDAEM